jgi:TonB family protein
MLTRPLFPPLCILALLAALAVPHASSAQDSGKAPDSQQNNKKADDTPNEPVYDLGKDITPPRLIHQVYPAYDPGSHGVRVAGKVLIRLIVSSAGLPKNPSIVQGLAAEVDRSALDAVKQWRFDPAKRQGMPVAVRVVVEINFHPL